MEQPPSTIQLDPLLDRIILKAVGLATEITSLVENAEWPQRANNAAQELRNCILRSSARLKDLGFQLTPDQANLQRFAEDFVHLQIRVLQYVHEKLGKISRQHKPGKKSLFTSMLDGVGISSCKDTLDGCREKVRRAFTPLEVGRV
ncbi:hypothetical protein M407DRAFT_9514 [Tulasnella calospora MUT 4182]|uniref:Uncharacterized protein n=1 Tax=Tulasnella calospora MUT 4182 TaxID=1051891 RepID=A0A0C3LP44_9AGAM|nr:hypothetical protein M407DRAFT_9514 [Tulasnella calospora MUT 4182]